MEEASDNLKSFLNKRIRVLKNDGSFLVGESISIDCYLNLVITNAKYVKGGEIVDFSFMFVRGSFVESISLE